MDHRPIVDLFWMDRLRWKATRLRTMESREVIYRIRRMIQVQYEKRGMGLAAHQEPAGTAGRNWLGHPSRGIDATLYTRAADRVMAGTFDLFGWHEVKPGFPPPWNRDPKSGIDAPLSFGKSIDYRDESEVGDIKYLWEINRHLDLVTLAQAWQLTGRERYLEGSRTFLESWLDQCPYPRGANWTSSLELAYRLVNWSCAWHLLGGERSPLFAGGRGESFKHAWLGSVRQHLHFVHGHLSFFSSSNNHLIGEYMGLFIGAVTWPLWSECGEWRALAGNGLEAEAARQTCIDGVNREQAIWYAHSVTDMLLHAALAGRANGIEFSGAYWTRLLRMLEYLASVMDIAGRVPMFGDADDAVVVRLSRQPGFDVYRSLLATGAVLFGRGDFKSKAGVFDDKSRWLLGDDAAKRFEALPAPANKLPVRREFPEGGYWILGDRLELPDEVRLVADAGPLGFLSIAAHGHADALSFVLSVHGREILVDPGTYAYHTERKWRDYFRGTSAHNTLRVDGQDQSVSGGSFLWTKHARGKCHRFESNETQDEWEGSHDGYLRLSEPVRHRRNIVFDKQARIIHVADRLEGTGVHSLEMFWHFAETCRVDGGHDGFDVRQDGVQVKLRPPRNLRFRLEKGAELPPLGWISRGLDRKTPTMTLVCAGEVKAPLTLRTFISIEAPLS